MLNRRSEQGAPPWLNGEVLGLDPLSHRLLGLSLAHAISLHGGIEDTPFPKGDDLECGSVLYRLALIPPAGINELAKRLADDSPLRQQGLIDISENWSHRRKRAADGAFAISRFMRTRFSLNVHALSHLLGLQATVEEKQGPSLDELVLPEEVRTTVGCLLQRPPATGQPFTIYLKGPEHSGRHALAKAVATQLGLPLKNIRPYEGPQPNCCLLVEVPTSFDGDEWQILQGHKGLVFFREFDGEPRFDVEGRCDLVLDLGALNVGTLATFCIKQLRSAGPLFAACDPIDIARSGISPGKLVETIRRLKQEAELKGHSPDDVKGLLAKAIERTRANAEGSKFAEVVTPRLGIKDICLPSKVMERFKRVIRSIRGRKDMLSNWGLDPSLVGRAQGICMFHGPSGTGKSLAAEVLANELGLPLWRMQASELESAYVGESETRLHKFFANAKGTPCVLLLDEADSVLQDRGKAEGSTRRYQVSLVNAWLRELDQFDGVLILTTNHPGLDPAFERRIQFRIEFPSPDAAVREQIWINLIGMAPIPGRGDLDLKGVAERYPLAGGRIRNAFVDACHRAAEVGRINQDMLLDACEEEFQSALPKDGQGLKRIRGFSTVG